VAGKATAERLGREEKMLSYLNIFLEDTISYIFNYVCNNKKVSSLN
jgi:hypothetical protein